jgi:hypothetical protein
MVLLTTSWSLSFRDDLAYPRTGSPALRDRLWTLLLTLLGGLSVPFLLKAVLVSIYYRITRPISFVLLLPRFPFSRLSVIGGGGAETT